ncbi:MAG: DNA mismatch repair endonuclease MutL [Selenomonadaceae bacterium]|nr:DNA mismatch repair endonuclease MutL [Selenomonadaceae bacterium]
MSVVHVLDDNTINKIAAGEVVERPASVVKELTENAMDAGATRIEAEMMGGGVSFLRVTDNGRGMSDADARLAILRHATSKIREVKDLDSIATLGFRGEALPTIAAVSRFSLTTRIEGEELGTKVVIVGGGSPEVEEIGCRLGTTIKVEDLFFNVPARKKFLKTAQTESGRISEFFMKLALSRPDIAFRLVNNNRLSMVTPGGGDLADTIKSLYGGEAAEALLPLELAEGEIKITGFITKPSCLRSSRAWQTIVVNGRLIRSLAIFKAIDNAYKSLIPKSGFPLAVLNITVPPSTIDVNVHPQKTEIRFEDEGAVYKAVYKAVSEAVRPSVVRSVETLEQVAASVMRPEKHFSAAPLEFSREAEEALKGSYALDFREAQSRLQGELPRSSGGGASDFSAEYFASEHAAGENQIVARTVAGDAPMAEPEKLRPLGQVALCYIIAQDGSSLYIVDQHAAHERILFDKLSGLAEAIPSQQLLVHIVMNFSPKETAVIAANLAVFQRLGFSLEPSGENEFRLREVPADIRAGEAEDIIREIITSLMERQEPSAKDVREACLAITACRAAIKAGDELTLPQMEILLDKLAHTPYPYTCPHGRPTILKFTAGELDKMFQRTGFHFGK